MDLSSAFLCALIPTIIGGLCWLARHCVGETPKAIAEREQLAKAEQAERERRAAEKAEAARILREQIKTTDQLAAEARRAKLTHSHKRTPENGYAVAAARRNLKNFVYNHRALRERLWALVQAFDDGLANPRCPDPARQYAALDEATRRWLNDLMI